MLMESLENRRLFAANPVAALAAAGAVGTLAQTTPGAVAAVAKPAGAGVTLAGETPTPPPQASHASPVAAAAQGGTIADLAQSEPGAVADLGRPA